MTERIICVCGGRRYGEAAWDADADADGIERLKAILRVWTDYKALE
jgi:hypothetical protein